MLQTATAGQISCESFFVQEGEDFTRPMVPKNVDKVAASCKHGTFRRYFMTKEGAAKVREAELDHCKDLQYAFDNSVGHIAAIVNGLAGSHFPSQQAAEDAVIKRVGAKPETWTATYLALCEKTRLRDTNGWHTPPEIKGPMENMDETAAGQCVTSQARRIDESVYPEVGSGQHPSSEIIK